jgi:L-threonylcarbamoyladenylate synthase
MMSELEIVKAVALLDAGELVAIPTETVYGLAADAENPQAVAKIYAAKGRPQDHPVIVHVARHAELSHWAAQVPGYAQKLIDAFWPGPLTLVLPKQPGVADACTGGQATIALRCPAHPLTQALLAAFRHGQGGLAAPSANRFGRVSPTKAQHVREEFSADEVPLVLDGGPCGVGIESTIVDCTRDDTQGPALLRPGMITQPQIEAVLGRPLRVADGQAPRVSGSLKSHYAPRAAVRLMTLAQIQTALDVLGDQARHIALYTRGAVRTRAPLEQRRMPADAAAAAHELFAVLRELDSHDTRLIWVEQPPEGADWAGVLDRLTRAAA